MDGLSIEITNVCNRRCLHCIRNEADPPEFLSLTLAREVLAQAQALGFRTICLTGGEVALYPHLEGFIALVADGGFTFSLVTNGHRFRERLLPLLSAPQNREKLSAVCFSLDGAKPESHDALRGPGSFREVVEATALCQLKGLPFGLKSVITNFNKDELADLALLGATLGAEDHGFLAPFPSPRLIREGAIPPPAEVRRLVQWIAHSLAPALRSKIIIEGHGPLTGVFTCNNILDCLHLDFQGNLVLCCNLSRITGEEGQPSVFGGEWLGNLQEVPLREGVIRHFHGYAQLIEARLREPGSITDQPFDACYWCFRHFGKLEWLRDFPESPWAAGVLPEEGNHADI